MIEYDNGMANYMNGMGAALAGAPAWAGVMAGLVAGAMPVAPAVPVGGANAWAGLGLGGIGGMARPRPALPAPIPYDDNAKKLEDALKGGDKKMATGEASGSKPRRSPRKRG